MKVYGPYTRKDGRQHVVLYDHNEGIRTTVSYGKYLLEQKIGRKLEDHETCDHIDGDFTNNNLDNLQVLSRIENIQKHAVIHNVKETVLCTCDECGTQFVREARILRYKKAKNVFCSRRCSGVYSNRQRKCT